MVAIIKTGHSIHNIFNYNENKVKQGVAVCIGEGNYPLDVDKMNGTMKLNRFLKQLALNDNVKRNSVHISLNFDSSEINLPKEKLIEITNTYMEKIGFGQQPYLVYQHHDAGHPHIHIVSIKVRADGCRIDMQNIGRNQSETARKEIEKSFALVVAEKGLKKQPLELLPIYSSKIHYGQIQSKKAIANVLDAVLASYKYASLPELNAVLNQYNVYADRGSENSRIFKANGLVYRILDQNGKPIGVPIKASDFHNKPTLKFLEEKFIANKNKSITHSKRVKNLVDLALLNQKLTLPELSKTLEKKGIVIVSRTNSEGLVYGITYVDHTTKCVFNGSSLGKEYSAKAIQERCGTAVSKTLKIPSERKTNLKTKMLPNTAKVGVANEANSKGTISGNSLAGELVEILIEPEFVGNFVPNPLKKRHKKRKKKGQSDNQ